MSDGKVVIGTKLDKSGLEQGLKTLATTLKAGITALGLNTLKNVVMDIADETKALNDSVRKASTLFGDVAVDTDLLKKKMSELAMSTGTSSEVIGEALYNALSAGIEASEDMGTALSFIESSIKTSTAGFADLGDTVTATASVLNAYGMATKEADKVQKILVQTQNLGITTVGELASTLSQVIPTASAFSVSFEQIGASIATLTSQGTKTAQATTSLNALLAELGKQSQQASKNLAKATEEAGLGAKTFQELTNEGHTIVDILKILSDYAEKNGLSLVDMFGSIEAGKASLQLMTGEGEKFNSALEVMAQESNIVEESFDKVVANSDRLHNSFTELKKIVGNQFAPIVDKVSGNLADLLEKTLSVGKESKQLAEDYKKLTKALENYKKVQEEAKVATDALSLSLAEQSRQKLASSVFENAEIYGKAVSSIKDLEVENENLRKDISDMWATIEAEADKYGLTLKDIAIYSTQGMYEEEGFYSDAVVAYREGTKAITEWGEQIDENTTLIEKNRRETANYIAQMESLVSRGALDMDILASAGYGLADAVQKYKSHMNQALSESKSFGQDVKSLTSTLALYESNFKKADVGSAGWVKWSAYVDVYKGLLEEALEAQESLTEASGSGDSSPIPDPSENRIADAYDEINKKLDDAEKIAKALGESFDLVGSQVRIATDGVENLVTLGLDPADERITGLVAKINEWNEQNAKQEDSVYKVTDTLETMNAEIEQAEKMHEALGDEYDIASAKAYAYRRAIEEMLENGIMPADDEVMKLVEALKALEEAPENVVKDGSWEAISKIFSDFASIDNISKKISGALSNSFSAMADSIATAGQRIEELSDRIDDYESKISDAEEKKLDLQEELADAQARGDEDAEKNAKKKISDLEKQISKHKDLKSALEGEKKAIETGASAWKAFGKSALLALAEVLDALGHQLSAQAVTALLTGNFVGSGLALAGASTAYLASAGIKSASNSFATGGIVQKQAGVSSSGDNHIVFANAGELILNQAQQTNLADQIRALSEGYSSKGSINISLNGAHIYGLDEPAVGRAIYENIENLRAEGVL